MAGGGEAGVDLSRKFVSEAELDKRRQQRQEEWEKVRKPDDPKGKKRGLFHHMLYTCLGVCKQKDICIHVHVQTCRYVFI